MTNNNEHTFTITETGKMELVCEDGLSMGDSDAGIVEDMVWILNDERGNPEDQAATSKEMAAIWLLLANVADGTVQESDEHEGAWDHLADEHVAAYDTSVDE